MVNVSSTTRGAAPLAATKFKTWQLVVAVVLIATPLTLAGVNFWLPGLVSGGRSSIVAKVASAVGNGPSNFLAMLGLRSPGLRKEGELADTKNHAPVTPEIVPHQRALAKVRPAALSGKLLHLTPAAPQIAEGLPPGLLVVPSASNSPASSQDSGPSGGTPVFLGDTPGGGGGGGGGPIVTPENPPIPSGVPEPGTWALMIMGLGGIGVSLRRTRGKRVAGQQLEAVSRSR